MFFSWVTNFKITCKPPSECIGVVWLGQSQLISTQTPYISPPLFGLDEIATLWSQPIFRKNGLLGAPVS